MAGNASWITATKNASWKLTPRSVEVPELLPQTSYRINTAGEPWTKIPAGTWLGWAIVGCNNHDPRNVRARCQELVGVPDGSDYRLQCQWTVPKKFYGKELAGYAARGNGNFS